MDECHWPADFSGILHRLIPRAGWRSNRHCHPGSKHDVIRNRVWCDSLGDESWLSERLHCGCGRWCRASSELPDLRQVRKDVQEGEHSAILQICQGDGEGGIGALVRPWVALSEAAIVIRPSEGTSIMDHLMSNSNLSPLREVVGKISAYDVLVSLLPSGSAHQLWHFAFV
jgi:hypothetical protein